MDHPLKETEHGKQKCFKLKKHEYFNLYEILADCLLWKQSKHCLNQGWKDDFVQRAQGSISVDAMTQYPGRAGVMVDVCICQS